MSQTEQYAEIQLNFRQTVLPSTGYKQTQSYFRAGKVTQLIFHFPPGCNGLVDMVLLKDEQPFYPLSGTLALDNATPVIYVDADCYAKEPFTLIVSNRDSANSHSPTCTVSIRFTKPSWFEQ